MRSMLDVLHTKYVHARRVTVLAARLAPLLPRNARVLDVGCGDGKLAAQLQSRRPDVHVDGVDVLVRAQTGIPVRPYDGVHLPYPDHSVDVVLMVDVLHHAHDPLVLLREAARVARSGVLLKDHLREGCFARATLRFMDWVGNARHGVMLPYTYWTALEWSRAFGLLGLVERHREGELRLYPGAASLLFDRSLHFIAFLGVPTGRTELPGPPALRATPVDART